MRLGSSTTAAATTGPASGPLPASSQPAIGKMPLLRARRSRRNVGRKAGSLSGSRGLDLSFSGIATMSARKDPQVNAPRPDRVDGVDYPGSVSEQTQLLGPGLRLSEILCCQGGARDIEAQLFAGHLEAAAYHPRIRTGAYHAGSPGGIVVLASAHIADQLEHVPVAVRIVRHQPFAEQVTHLERQTQKYVTRFLHAGRARCVKNTLYLHVIKRRNYGRNHDGRRHARLAQSPYCLQTPHRCGSPRFHLAGERRI